MEKNDTSAPPARAAGRAARRATSYDVARVAGVSQSAVSRCFAEGASIAPATRERILKVAVELGYRPNALAQGLISGRSNMVAVLISRLTTLFYPEVLAELSGRLTNRDIRVLLFSLASESEVDAVLEQVLRHPVDGVISAARLSHAQERTFSERGIPLVLYNRPAHGRGAASVACDSTAGERHLVERLLAAGHRRFGIIAGPADSYVGEERRRAAVARLEEANLTDVPTVRGDYGYASGQTAMHAFANAEAPIPDAVICVNDVMALGAMDVARMDLGLAIPADISIVGFDGSDPAYWASYELASVRQPVRRMTEAAVTMLMERLDDPTASPEHRIFEGEFVEGRSARFG